MCLHEGTEAKVIQTLFPIHKSLSIEARAGGVSITAYVHSGRILQLCSSAALLNHNDYHMNTTVSCLGVGACRRQSTVVIVARVPLGNARDVPQMSDVWV